MGGLTAAALPRLALVLASAAAALASPATAGAVSVTIGPASIAQQGPAISCIAIQDGCPYRMIVQTSLSDAGTHATAPYDGTITSWRVRGNFNNPAAGALRVMRP